MLYCLQCVTLFPRHFRVVYVPRETLPVVFQIMQQICLASLASDPLDCSSLIFCVILCMFSLELFAEYALWMYISNETSSIFIHIRMFCL